MWVVFLKLWVCVGIRGEQVGFDLFVILFDIGFVQDCLDVVFRNIFVRNCFVGEVFYFFDCGFVGYRGVVYGEDFVRVFYGVVFFGEFFVGEDFQFCIFQCVQIVDYDFVDGKVFVVWCVFV